jgi:hypothetical protein
MNSRHSSDERDQSNGQAMLRAQAQVLLQQASAQAVELQASLHSLRDNAAQYAPLSRALSAVDRVISELTQALAGPVTSLRPSDLAMLHQAVRAAVASAKAAETAAAADQSGSQITGAAAQVTAAAAETRKEVETLSRDLYDGHLFEPYLRFSSKDDEEAFRRRQAERKRYIEEQLARHTPEGNYNAGTKMVGEMLDQRDHGADKSPEFAGRFNQLTSKLDQQRAATISAHQSTHEGDANLLEAVRGSLEAKHWRKEQIDAFIAQAGDAISAARKAGAGALPAPRVQERPAVIGKDDLSAIGADLAAKLGNGPESGTPPGPAPVSVPGVRSAAITP